jgi:hypothetical protein
MNYTVVSRVGYLNSRMQAQTMKQHISSKMSNGNRPLERSFCCCCRLLKLKLTSKVTVHTSEISKRPPSIALELEKIKLDYLPAVFNELIQLLTEDFENPKHVCSIANISQHTRQV